MEYVEDDPQNEKTYHVREFEEFVKMNTLTKAISDSMQSILNVNNIFT